MMNPVMVAALLSLPLAACDAGSYNPSAHRQDDASTGSLLSGTDTGANGNGSISDPSIRSNTGAGAPSSGGR